MSNACNDTNSVCPPNAELLVQLFPNVPLSRAVAPHESLPSNRKIRDLLGFKEQHNWRRYGADPIA